MGYCSRKRTQEFSIKKTVCFLGNFIKDYPRNTILEKAFKKAGFKVIKLHLKKAFPGRFVEFFKKRKKIKTDYIFIPFGAFAQIDVIFAKMLFKKPVIFDIFIPLYEAYVKDRKTVKAKSTRAIILWLLDFLSLHLADTTIVVTEEYIKYLTKEYRFSKKKIHRVLLGTREDFFKPRSFSKKDKKFTVGFHGNFIPLQGIEYIIEAANILKKQKNIVFNLLGRGQTFEKNFTKAKKLGLKNINFLDRIPFSQIPGFIAGNDIMLGAPFGKSEKSARVIPNKIFECLAMKKPTIVGDTPATRELLKDKKDVLFTKRKNGKDIAEKILLLRKDKKLREKIAKGGYKTFKEKASLEKISQRLKKILA